MKTKNGSRVLGEKSQNTNSVVFLRGRKTILRPLSSNDINRCTQWINDPEVRQFISTHFPIDEWKEEEYLKKVNTEKNIMLAIETLNGTHIGNISLGSINWINRTATTGTMIGDKKYWSKGYGTDAKMTLMDYAFNTLGLRKLHSGAYGFNERSVNYSLKCGYKIIGRYKEDLFRDGKFHDHVLLEVFADEWRQAHKKWLADQKG